MKNFIVLDENGNAKRHGQCLDKVFSLQAGENETIIEGKFDHQLQKVVNGKIEDQTTEEKEKHKPKKRMAITENNQRAVLTNGQYKNILDRLEQLEKGK